MKKEKRDPALTDFSDIKTIRDIVLHGVKFGGDKRQFVFNNFEKEIEEKSFNQVFHDTCGLGQYFYKKGLKGKKIAILSENSYYWVAIYYAISIGDFVCIPLDAQLTDEDLTDIIARSKCDAICYSKTFESAVKMIKSTDGVVIREYIKIEDFYSIVEEGHKELANGKSSFLNDEIKPDDLAFICYTSGTTGKSKGVMLTQRNVASDATATLELLTARQTIAFLPFNHTFSWASALMASPLLAEWGYICKSLKDLQKDMNEYHPQHFSGVPLAVETIYKKINYTVKKKGMEQKLQIGLKISNFLLKFGIDVRRKLFAEVIDNLGGNLDMIICGGSYLDEKYERGLYELGIDVMNGYGLTECSPVVTVNSRHLTKFGSAGRALPCNEIKIHNPDEDGIGEIYVRGSNVMVGYYDDPEATAEVFDDGWFKTGDYGYIDKDGFLFFRGRKKNLIVLSNGKNVAPEELEDKLYGIEYVKEVLVYEEDGLIAAEFYLDTVEFPDAKDRIRSDVNDFNRKMPAYKQIGKVKTRDTEFPKTTTLKIKRPKK